jgi:hypothetical protein
MLVRLQCPACAKSLILECDAATEVLVCRACGAQFDPPPDCVLPTEPEPEASAPVTPARALRKRSSVVPIATATVVVLAMIGGLVAAILSRRAQTQQKTQTTNTLAGTPAQAVSPLPQNEHPETDQALALKTDAEVLALSGNFGGAADKYKQARALLNGPDAADPVAQELSRQIADGERNVNAILATQPRTTAPASTPDTSAGAYGTAGSGSDFGPTAVAPAKTSSPTVAPADFDPPATPVTASSVSPASDFAAGAPVIADHTNRTLPAAALADLRGISDAEIGRSIERGVAFLLAQFKDGEISPDTVLSDSQRQALDALCVYALAQSGLSINDSRLTSHGQLMTEMLDKLRAYDMNSDGQTTNRPITYGRSLRAAAIATYDRPADRDTLKNDVAWLITNQIGGAYTYDDIFVKMMGQGMKPADDGMPGPARDHGAVIPPGKRSCSDFGGNFGGGSAPPTVSPGDGPYLGGSTPPPTPTPVPGSGGGGGGGIPVTPGSPPPPPTPRWDIPPVFRFVPPPFSRGYMTPFPPAYTGPNAPHPTPPKPIGSGPVPSGGGTYIPPILNDATNVPLPPQTFIYPWDNSNSQYGLLGVWAGAEVGIEVPDQYWQDVEHHWVKWQLGTGEWTYHAHDPAGYYAMTVAGTASLLVTHDYLDIPLLKGAIGREPYSNSLQAALNWLEQGNNSITIPNANTHYVGYDLFGIERVGLASGYKYFGSHDWYRELAGKVVPLQFANGAWGHEDHGNDAVVDTAYTLLFLARGRHPVMMTKLKFPGSWDNRPRDVANLAKFASHELERQINWQVVSIDHDWQDYFDSPVLYIASHQAPQLKDADYLKLRNFVLAGGLIFTQADGSSASFNEWIPELAKKIAPAFKLAPLPDNSPIYSIQYKVPSHPQMLGVYNGSRLMLVHSPTDLSLAWQGRSTKTKRFAFEIGTNVFVYASGKPDLRNRLDSPYVPAPPESSQKPFPVAALTYDGNWNPEPAAWFRMSRYLQWEGGPALAIRPIPLQQIAPGAAPMATLTGTDAHNFSQPEIAALRAYVQGGGTLLIDSVGGDNAFTRSVRDKLLPAAFGDGIEQQLPPDHPLFKDLKAGLANASPVRLRAYAVEHLGQVAPAIRLIKVGNGYVVFSALDLTSGLLGTNTWGIVGYETVSAEKFSKNLVLWLSRN